jgi:hypothetical protein
MPNSLQARSRHALKIAIAMTPWVIAMYLFYWLDSSGTWTSETAHRGKLSVAILGAGMALTFLVWSHFAKRGNNE